MIKRYNKGFTLLELLVVIGLIIIVFSKTTPVFANVIDNAKIRICEYNCKIVEREYEKYLLEKEVDHNELVFNEFLMTNQFNQCPSGGSYTYLELTIKCDFHDVIEQGEEEVPYI